MTELPQTAPRKPLPRRTVRGRGLVAAMVVAAGLLLAGCTTQDTAAVVDGQKISTRDAQTAAQEINTQFTPQTPVTTTDALNYLIIAPTVLAAAAKAGKPQSPDVVRTEFTKVQDPNPAAITILQVVRAVQGLDDATRTGLGASIAKLDVSVNPRFGSFDAKQGGLVPESPHWIVPTPTATTTAPATP